MVDAHPGEVDAAGTKGSSVEAETVVDSSALGDTCVDPALAADTATMQSVGTEAALQIAEAEAIAVDVGPAANQVAEATIACEVGVDNCFRLVATAVRKGKGKGKHKGQTIADSTGASECDGDVDAHMASGGVAEPDASNIPGVTDSGDAVDATEPPAKRAKLEESSTAVRKDDANILCTLPSPDGSPSPDGDLPPLPSPSPSAASDGEQMSIPSPLASPEPDGPLKEPTALAKLSVSKLKVVARYHNVDISGCLEKAEMVEELRKAGVDGKAAQDAGEAQKPAQAFSKSASPAAPIPKSGGDPPLKGLKASWRNWKPAFAATPYVFDSPQQQSPVVSAVQQPSHQKEMPLGGTPYGWNCSGDQYGGKPYGAASNSWKYSNGSMPDGNSSYMSASRRNVSYGGSSWRMDDSGNDTSENVSDQRDSAGNDSCGGMLNGVTSQAPAPPKPKYAASARPCSSRLTGLSMSGVGSKLPMQFPEGVDPKFVCWEFKRGHCKKGSACSWMHVAPKAPGAGAK